MTASSQPGNAAPADRIRLTGIRAEAVIGVYAHERNAPRPLRIDVELHVDTRAAAASDDVADTVDYDAVTARLRAICQDTAPRLLERLADDMCKAVLAGFPVSAVRLALHKPGAVADVDDIVVELFRCRYPAD